MDTSSTVERIRQYNLGREPVRLALKYGRMAADPFTFFRGSCHLFYEDMPADGICGGAPPVWLCGDLHLENFGSYKGDNGLAYFDINDFDEGILGPATWDLARFLTSLWLGAEQIGLNQRQGLSLERSFVSSYREALAGGKARWVERGVAAGMVGDLLGNLQGRRAFLDSRTELAGRGTRRIRRDPGKNLEIPEPERRKIARLVEHFAHGQPQPEAYGFIDLAGRIAGTGSLGLRRYEILVEGKGSPGGNYLLDLKEAQVSSLARHTRLPQPPWPSEAGRAIEIQRRVQAVSPALLHAAELDGRSWILRELQPSKDRLRLDGWEGKLGRLERVVGTMGRLVAWGQLGSGGREGSATADELIAFSHRHDWPTPLVEYAQAYGDRVRADWRSFADWWKIESGKR